MMILVDDFICDRIDHPALSGGQFVDAFGGHGTATVTANDQRARLGLDPDQRPLSVWCCCRWRLQSQLSLSWRLQPSQPGGRALHAIAAHGLLGSDHAKRRW